MLYMNRRIDERESEAHSKPYIFGFQQNGRLEEAEKIALEIPIDQKAVVWRMLLGACSVYDDAEMDERITRKLMELEGSHGGDYVLMSNILCDFSDAQRFRKLMDVRGVVKHAGHSQLT
ncbi:hypothetical protein CARUB_v10011104mg [Capsella rubella]|uniref:DYW domain-containing protein n=1 Tax=Capsella rubella TaxID=81985 RepID=R0IE51_9BRAS|nr:hypothetical protein CARUB_v10011104mg [Capsella rubella]